MSTLDLIYVLSEWAMTLINSNKMDYWISMRMVWLLLLLLMAVSCHAYIEETDMRGMYLCLWIFFSNLVNLAKNKFYFKSQYGGCNTHTHTHTYQQNAQINDILVWWLFSCLMRRVNYILCHSHIRWLLHIVLFVVYDIILVGWHVIG